MASADQFTPEEWREITELPMRVIMGAVVSDVKGPRNASGMEVAAAAKHLAAGAREYPGNDLIMSVLQEIANSETDISSDQHVSLNDEAARSAQVMDVYSRCNAVAGYLGAIEDDIETEIYKRWLYEVASAAVMASKSNGILGFGRETVSTEEYSFLVDLATNLGLDIEA